MIAESSVGNVIDWDVIQFVTAESKAEVVDDRWSEDSGVARANCWVGVADVPANDASSLRWTGVEIPGIVVTG